MVTAMQTLADLGASMGHVRDIQIVEGSYDCPVHDVPLQEQQLDSVSGWQSLLVCPAFDGTCRYDPDGAPVQIDPPEPAKPDEPAEPATGTV